jgi:hypothetical protein
MPQAADCLLLHAAQGLFLIFSINYLLFSILPVARLPRGMGRQVCFLIFYLSSSFPQTSKDPILLAFQTFDVLLPVLAD